VHGAEQLADDPEADAEAGDVGLAAVAEAVEQLGEALGQERETARLAEEARQASERISRRQQQFATVAAHELRTPVTAVLGSLTTVERLIPPETLPPPAGELLAACTR